MENNPFDVPGQNPPNEPKIIPEPKPASRFAGWLKSLLIFIILCLIVIASFWISLQLGKRILSPANKLSEERIKAAIPEPPPSIKKLQELGINISGEARGRLEKAFATCPKKVLEKKPAAKKKVHIREMKHTRVVRHAAAAKGYYYKLQAGLFADKAGAKMLEEKLKAAGVDVFIKKVSAGYRVQAGAYKTRSAAAAMQSNLKKKGFSSTVIREDN